MTSRLLYRAARPLLFALNAEQAHHVTLVGLELARCAHLGQLTAQRIANDARVVMGLTFPNPVGLAAGLDKEGRYIDALAGLGFGSIEVGTVTPRAQPGNVRPRLFRLPGKEALINRMGFNNGGLAAFVEHVTAARFRGVLGLNIGKNADTPIERAVEDYLTCLRGVYPHASYVTVNVSSPNTKNLRQLQGAGELGPLLTAMKEEQARLSDQHGRYVPLALKVAPDLDAEQIKLMSATLIAHRIDGLIATNTTLARDGVEGDPAAGEAGGLSGRPLLERSNATIRAFKAELGDAIPIIGVGGIMSASDAQQKIAAGAALVQLYTGLIYRGPALIRECASALRATAHA
jgi:dihydroorotate dehydrogenase